MITALHTNTQGRHARRSPKVGSMPKGAETGAVGRERNCGEPARRSPQRCPMQSCGQPAKRGTTRGAAVPSECSSAGLAHHSGVSVNAASPFWHCTPQRVKGLDAETTMRPSWNAWIPGAGSPAPLRAPGRERRREAAARGFAAPAPCGQTAEFNRGGPTRTRGRRQSNPPSTPTVGARPDGLD